MKRITLILTLVLAIIFTSCSTYSPPSKYQGRNLSKFSKKKHLVGKGNARHKVVSFSKSGSTWHGAVPKEVRRELRRRNWSVRTGAGSGR